jgi:hypothetical protein
LDLRSKSLWAICYNNPMGMIFTRREALLGFTASASALAAAAHAVD